MMVNPDVDGYCLYQNPKSPENTPKITQEPTENEKNTEVKI